MTAFDDTPIEAPRRSLRIRLAVLYGGLCLAIGAVLVVLVDVPLFYGQSTHQASGTPHAAGTVANQQRVTDLGQLLTYSAVALAVMIVPSMIAGWLVAGRVLKPLRAIMATAQDIYAGTLHRRLGLDAPYDEYRQLGHTLNTLLARLEASFEAQRHFVANASHELRTPLTAERTVLQVALTDPGATVETLRAACEDVLALGRQQEGLIDALLTLARSEQGVERWERCDLAGIVGHVVSSRQREAERRGVDVTTTLDDAVLAGDARLLESLVANLVDNALRHNVPAGRVEISTLTTAAGAVLSIANTGPVIPPAEVDRILQPFQRLGDTRVRNSDGHGLGLAIVQAITVAHHAELAARPRPDGGLHIEVRFAGARPGPPSIRRSGPAS